MTRTTRLRRALALTAALFLTAAPLAACGSDDGPTSTGPALEIQDAWVRATVGAKDTSMTSAFMVVSNTTDTAFSITAARTDVAAMAEFHDMKSVDGKMVMAQMEDGIELEPGAGTVLQPGGKHVMLMGLDRELKAGDEVTFTLTYDGDKTATVTAPVKDAPEEEGHYHEPATPSASSAS